MVSSPGSRDVDGPASCAPTEWLRSALTQFSCQGSMQLDTLEILRHCEGDSRCLKNSDVPALTSINDPQFRNAKQGDSVPCSRKPNLGTAHRASTWVNVIVLSKGFATWRYWRVQQRCARIGRVLNELRSRFGCSGLCAKSGAKTMLAAPLLLNVYNLLSTVSYFFYDIS